MSELFCKAVFHGNLFIPYLMYVLIGTRLPLIATIFRHLFA